MLPVLKCLHDVLICFCCYKKIPESGYILKIRGLFNSQFSRSKSMTPSCTRFLIKVSWWYNSWLLNRKGNQAYVEEHVYARENRMCQVWFMRIHSYSDKYSPIRTRIYSLKKSINPSWRTQYLLIDALGTKPQCKFWWEQTIFKQQNMTNKWAILGSLTEKLLQV